MKKRLVVCDLDETLVEWNYSMRGNNYMLRTGAIELLEFIRDDLDADIVLFSTANLRYVRSVRMDLLHDFDILECHGAGSVTFYKKEAVKDISMFTNRYDIENIVLIDDKKRNARLYPWNYVRVSPPPRSGNKFDDELLKVQRRLTRYFEKLEKRLSEESL